MALETAIVSVSLAQGLNTKTDPKQVQSEYLSIQNAVYQTLEQLNLRSGYAALTKTTYTTGFSGTITAGYGLASLNQALLEHDGTTVWSRIGESNQWTYAGQKQAVTTTVQSIGSSSSPFFTSVNSARASNGLELYVWIDRQDSVATNLSQSGIAYFLVYDTINDVTVFQPSGILTGVAASPATSIRADAIGTNFFITYSDGTAIKIYKIASTNPKILGVTPTTVDAAAGVNFIDTCVSSSAVYILGDSVYRVDATTLAVTTSVAATYGRVPTAGINYDAVQNNVWIANISGTTVQAATLSSTLTVVKALSTVGTIPGTVVLGTTSLWVSNNQAYILVPTNHINTGEVLSVLLSAGSYTSAQSLINGNSMCSSKPYLNPVDGLLYFIGIFISVNDQNPNPTTFTAYNPTQPTTFLLKLDTSLIGSGAIIPVVVSRSLALQTGAPYSLESSSINIILYFSAPASLILVDANNWTFPNLQTTQEVAGYVPNLDANKILYPAEVVVRSLFSFFTKFRKSSLAQSIQSTGGYLSGYDTAQEVENNFNLFPEFASDPVVTGNSPGLANGTYEYTAVFRWVDALGQIQRSSPATPISIIISSGPSSVTLGIPILYLTDKTTYFIDIYRTTAGGTVFFFLKTVRVARNTTFGSFVDIVPDSGLSTLELYTTGGEVENIAPPATNYLTDFKNRLFLIPSENPYSIWYSKQQITNFGAEFSDLFVINLETRGGPAAALATLDDKLIILKRDALFYMVGDGPAPSGANNDFSYPQFIPCDSGVTEPDSVISFPNGVLFKGSKGIYLLDRSLIVSYIGADVESFNQYQITSAVLDYTKQLIRYTISNGSSLVYDYFVKKWSTFSNISASDSVIANGVYYYLKADGTVEQETSGSYGDDGSVISMIFKTGWLSFAKIQGFQRFKKLLLFGANYSACTLSVGFSYDFDPAIVHIETIINTAAIDPWQWRLFPQRQKSESVQLTFTITPSTIGRALSLSGIAMEVGVKKGFNKMPAALSVG